MEGSRLRAKLGCQRLPATHPEPLGGAGPGRAWLCFLLTTELWNVAAACARALQAGSAQGEGRAGVAAELGVGLVSRVGVNPFSSEKWGAGREESQGVGAARGAPASPKLLTPQRMGPWPAGPLALYAAAPVAPSRPPHASAQHLRRQKGCAPLPWIFPDSALLQPIRCLENRALPPVPQVPQVWWGFLLLAWWLPGSALP